MARHAGTSAAASATDAISATGYLESEDLTFVLLSNLQSAANWQIRGRIQKTLLGQPADAIPIPARRRTVRGPRVARGLVRSGGENHGRGQALQVIVAANDSVFSRTGTVVVAGHTLSVAQAGIECTNLVDFPISTAGGDGGSGTAAVTTLPGCSWTASTDVSWLEITSGTIGNGKRSGRIPHRSQSGLRTRRARRGR